MVKASPQAQATANVTLGAQGRFVIPAPFRKALDLAPGEHLLLRIEEERLVVEKPTAVERRIHARFSGAKGRSLADELIEERRREAAKEERG